MGLQRMINRLRKKKEEEKKNQPQVEHELTVTTGWQRIGNGFMTDCECRSLSHTPKDHRPSGTGLPQVYPPAQHNVPSRNYHSLIAMDPKKVLLFDGPIVCHLLIDNKADACPARKSPVWNIHGLNEPDHRVWMLIGLPSEGLLFAFEIGPLGLRTSNLGDDIVEPARPKWLDWAWVNLHGLKKTLD